MPKFSALCLADLKTSERDAGRVARKAKIIVATEADDGSWFDLDADSEAHARVLATNMVDTMGARGCSCWHVEKGGKLARKSFHNYYAQPAWAD